MSNPYSTEFFRLVQEARNRLNSDPNYRNSREYLAFLDKFQEGIQSVQSVQSTNQQPQQLDDLGLEVEDKKEPQPKSARERLNSRIGNLQSRRNRQMTKTQKKNASNQMETDRKATMDALMASITPNPNENSNSN